VFSTYSQITTTNTFSFIVTKHSKVIIKAIKQIAELHVKRQVINALRQQNSLNISDTLNVLIDKDVLVYKKKQGLKRTIHTCFKQQSDLYSYVVIKAYLIPNYIS
jgi:hypothetical protein